MKNPAALDTELLQHIEISNVNAVFKSAPVWYTHFTLSWNITVNIPHIPSAIREKLRQSHHHHVTVPVNSAIPVWLCWLGIAALSILKKKKKIKEKLLLSALLLYIINEMTAFQHHRSYYTCKLKLLVSVLVQLSLSWIHLSVDDEKQSLNRMTYFHPD